MPTFTRRILSIAVVGVGGLTIAGCESDTADDSSGNQDQVAVPSPEVGEFTDGDFDNIPKFRGATPLQSPTKQNGAIAASYETITARPDAVLRFYEANLPELGWTVVDPIAEINPGSWHGEWVREGRRLQVSASPLSPGEGDATHTQFSLVLLGDAGGYPVTSAPTG